MSLERFFEIFLHLNGEFGFVKYGSLNGNKDFHVTEIQEDQSKKGNWFGKL